MRILCVHLLKPGMRDCTTKGRSTIADDGRSRFAKQSGSCWCTKVHINGGGCALPSSISNSAGAVWRRWRLEVLAPIVALELVAPTSRLRRAEVVGASLAAFMALSCVAVTGPANGGELTARGSTVHDERLASGWP